MARIRTIKPEFWSDDKLGPLDPTTRLVFLGLVSQADDAGRLVDSVKRLNGLLFPFTEDDAGPCISLLSTLGVISRGTAANGQRVIQITGWSRHQYIEKPNLRAVLPPIVPPSKVRRRVPDDSGNNPPDVPDVSPGEVEGEVEGEVDQDQEGERDPDPRAREGSPSADDERPNFDGYVPTEAQRARAAELRVDLEHALRKWRAHRKANGRTPVDLVADFDGWLEDQPDFEREPEQSGPVQLPPIRWPKVEPDDSPPADPEIRKAGLELVKSTIAATNGGHGAKPVKAPPSSAVPEVVDDPAVIREREAERKRQLAAARRAVKT